MGALCAGAHCVQGYIVKMGVFNVPSLYDLYKIYANLDALKYMSTLCTWVHCVHGCIVNMGVFYVIAL